MNKKVKCDMVISSKSVWNQMNKKSICSRVNEQNMLYHGLLGGLSKNELELYLSNGGICIRSRKAVCGEVAVMSISYKANHQKVFV